MKNANWEWYQNPKTNLWYRTRPDDWLLYNRIGQDGGRGYQVQLQDFVKQYFALRPSRNALDIGANMGITAIEYAQYFKYVAAFEPIKDVYEQLLLVIKKNQCANIFPFNFAIGNEIRTVKMKYRANNSFASAVNDKGDQEVEMKTIDSYKFDNVDFIKIDVEGLETEVINGAWNTIEKWRPLIQFEYKHNLAKKFGYDVDQLICKRLEKIGYKIIDKKGITYTKTSHKDLFAVPGGK